MVEQPELPLRAAGPRAEIEDRLLELKAALRGRGWLTRSELEAFGFKDRELRDLVEKDGAGDVLSYPGSPGYKLFNEATLPEIERCDTLKSQAKAMMRRWIRYQRRRHGRTI